MYNKNYDVIIKNKKINFEKILNHYLNIAVEKKTIIFFIDKTSLFLVEKISTIICENKNCIVARFNQEFNIEKLSLLFSDEDFRMLKLFILSGEIELEKFCLNLLDLNHIQILKRINEFTQNLQVYYYSENFAESEILYINKNLLKQ